MKLVSDVCAWCPLTMEAQLFRVEKFSSTQLTIIEGVVPEMRKVGGTGIINLFKSHGVILLSAPKKVNDFLTNLCLNVPFLERGALTSKIFKLRCWHF